MIYRLATTAITRDQQFCIRTGRQHGIAGLIMGTRSKGMKLMITNEWIPRGKYRFAIEDRRHIVRPPRFQICEMPLREKKK